MSTASVRYIVDDVDAGLDEAAAETDVHALHGGRVLVLVTLGATSQARASELLDASV